MKTHSIHRQSGLNLVEILVAALILSVGLLSLAGLQVASLKSIQGATQKQQASFMIHELFERMRSNRAAALAGEYNTLSGGGSIAVDCSAVVATDCGSIAACSTAELAAYDLHTVQCGQSIAGVSTGLPIIDASFAVQCSAAPDGCASGVIVTLSWVERLADKNIEDPESDGLEPQTMSISANI